MNLAPMKVGLLRNHPCLDAESKGIDLDADQLYRTPGHISGQDQVLHRLDKSQKLKSYRKTRKS